MATQAVTVTALMEAGGEGTASFKETGAPQ